MKNRYSCLFLILVLLFSILTPPAFASTEGYWQLRHVEFFPTTTGTYTHYTSIESLSDGYAAYRRNYTNGAVASFSANWTRPPSIVERGENFSLDVSISIDSYQECNLRYYYPSIGAYSDKIDIRPGFSSRGDIFVQFKSEETGEMRAQAVIYDAEVRIASDSQRLTGDLGRGGVDRALIVGTGFGSVRYEYEWIPDATPAPAPPAPEPVIPEVEETQKVVFTGTVISVAGNPMRHMAVSLEPSFASPVKGQTDAGGRYLLETEFPANWQGPAFADLVLHFRHMPSGLIPLLDDGEEVWFSIRDGTQQPSQDVFAASRIRFDPGSPLHQDSSEIQITRNVFFNAPERNGQLHITSADFSGNQHDELRSNLPDTSVLPGFTYAYDQLSSAVYAALEKFNENHAVLSSFPLRVILNARKPAGSDAAFAHFDYRTNPLQIVASREYSQYNDSSRFTILHEFGHFFEYATNNNAFRCNWIDKMTRGIAAAEQRKEAVQQATVGGMVDQNRLTELNTFIYKSHLGYLNDDTGDSFVEGFATWYAAMVQRHGLMPIANYANVGEDGTLIENRKPWDSMTSEEFCIASILTRLERHEDVSLEDLWSVLRVDRENFHAYYHALLELDFLQENRAGLNQLMLDYGFYRHPFGNNRYDHHLELYYDASNSGSYMEGIDPFTDTIFEFDSMGEPKPVRTIDSEILQQKLDTAGQSSDASRNRDALPESTYRYPNRLLHVSGLSLDTDVLVRVIPDHEPANAYTITPINNKVYLGFPLTPDTGKVEVRIPGGGLLYSERLEVLQSRFRETTGQSTPIGEAVLTTSHLAPESVITKPVYGDPSQSPVQERVSRHNDPINHFIPESPDAFGLQRGTVPPGSNELTDLPHNPNNPFQLDIQSEERPSRPEPSPMTVYADGTIVLTIGSQTAYVDGRVQQLDAAAFIHEGRTMVPFRFIGEQLGAEIYWEPSLRMVSYILERPDDLTIIDLFIDEPYAFYNDDLITIDRNLTVVPLIRSNRTFVPVRFISEALGCQVDWNPDTRQVIIYR